RCRPGERGIELRREGIVIAAARPLERSAGCREVGRIGVAFQVSIAGAVHGDACRCIPNGAVAGGGRGGEFGRTPQITRNAGTDHWATSLAGGPRGAVGEVRTPRGPPAPASAEFGRTPQINRNAGRDHWAAGFWARRWWCAWASSAARRGASPRCWRT